MQIANDVPSLIGGEPVAPGDHGGAGNADGDDAKEESRRAIGHRVGVLRAGERIYEVPIAYRARTREEGKKLTALDGLRVLRTLVRCRIT